LRTTPFRFSRNSQSKRAWKSCRARAMNRYSSNDSGTDTTHYSYSSKDSGKDTTVVKTMVKTLWEGAVVKTVVKTLWTGTERYSSKGSGKDTKGILRSPHLQWLYCIVEYQGADVLRFRKGYAQGPNHLCLWTRPNTN
jgi:hypothetical protein